MTDILLAIAAVVFVVYAFFQIAYILSLKRAGDRAAAFLGNIEGNLNATLAELKGTLENVKKITDDARAVTSDVRHISATVTSLEKEIRGIYGHVKEGVSSFTEANIAGLQAGIKTGVVTLVKSLAEGRSDNHDGKC